MMFNCTWLPFMLVEGMVGQNNVQLYQVNNPVAGGIVGKKGMFNCTWLPIVLVGGMFFTTLLYP